jgi:hypothetical protein
MSFQLQSNSKNVRIEYALGDTGATGLFIDEHYVKKNKIPQIELQEPIDVYNVDRTPNRKGTITHYVKILSTIGKRTKWTELYVTHLGSQTIILGLPWFQNYNPDIDWSSGKISWKRSQKKEDPGFPVKPQDSWSTRPQKSNSRYTIPQKRNRHNQILINLIPKSTRNQKQST